MTLELRCLDPKTDADLFRLAYSWRTKPKKHVQPDRMPFEAFASEDPDQIVMGLFNGELQAVYLFRQWKPGYFEAHFTAERGTPKENVLAGAKTTLDWFMENGAIEVCAWIRPRNRPVCQFVEALGFVEDDLREFNQIVFVRYAAKRSDQILE